MDVAGEGLRCSQIARGRWMVSDPYERQSSTIQACGEEWSRDITRKTGRWLGSRNAEQCSQTSWS